MVDHFLDLYRHRALLDCLVRREVRARYRGSVLGFLWTFLNPLLLLGVYFLVFDRITGAVRVERYPLFLFAGILPWLWISSSLSAGSVSILQDAHLVTQACLPPAVPPAVVVLSNLFNLVLSIPLAVAAGALLGVAPGWGLLLLPPALLLLLLFLYGATLAVAALTVVFRDVQHLVQNLLLVWFFTTPVAYPASAVPGAWRAFLPLNPAAALLLPFQRVLHQGASPSAGEMGLAALWAAVALGTGVAVFEALRGRAVEEL